MDNWNFAPKHLNKAYRYIGRFLHLFASVENNIDEIFLQTFNVDGLGFASILLKHIDLRKKLKLIQLGFEHQGSDYKKTLDKIQHLHDVRNAIAHSWFEPALPVVRPFHWL